MKCEYCGTVIPDGAEECPACGAGIEQTESPAAEENTLPKEGIRCWNCETENDRTVQYCSHCGEKLDPDLISSKCGGTEFDAAAAERDEAEEVSIQFKAKTAIGCYILIFLITTGLFGLLYFHDHGVVYLIGGILSLVSSLMLIILYWLHDQLA